MSEAPETTDGVDEPQTATDDAQSPEDSE